MLVSWETWVGIKKQQLEPSMNQLVVQDWEGSMTGLSFDIKKQKTKQTKKKTKILASGPITSWQIEGENVEE